MTPLWPALFALLALALAFAALGLYLQARRRGLQDEVLARLQAGFVETDALWRGGLQARNPLLRWTCHRLWQAGLELSVNQVAVLLLAAPVLALLLPLAFGAGMGAILALLLAAGTAVVLAQLAGRRRRQIVQQLPDFLEHALRALMAGNTLEEAVAEAAAEAPEPLRTLFLSISRQVRFGAPIEDAVAQAAEVHDLVDLRVLAMAARVNRRYGGSIRSMVRSLVQVIRARGTAARKLRALTMETRISAISLFIIPLGISAYIILSNPGFYNDIWNYGLGRAVLLGSFFWQLLGGLLMWRMIRSTAGGA